MEQPPKTNPITRERFVSPFKLSISRHSVFCGIISLLRFGKHRHLFFRVSVSAPNPFLLYFAHPAAASQGGGVNFIFMQDELPET